LKKHSKNKYLAKIAVALGETDWPRAVSLFVAKFREHGEPLELIAKRLGVVETIKEPLPFDGGVFETARGSVVKINSLSPPVRQAFTLAHEIGHLMLPRSRRASLGCSNDTELEIACDAIAAELLMPEEETRKLVRRLGNASPEKLKTIAASFGVSLQVAARRVTKDLRIWTGAVGLWKSDNDVKQMWMVGTRFWKDRTPQFAAFQYALDTQEVVKTKESFVEGDLVIPVRLEMLHIGKGLVLGTVAQ
jgi:hypothetical protein